MTSKRDGTAAKRTTSTRSDDTVNSDSEEMTISQLASRISKQLSNTKDELSRQMKADINNLKSEIRKDLEQMSSTLENSVTELSCRVNENKESIHHTAHNLSCSLNRNDLIISGVPFVQGEDLMDYFGKCCHALGFANTTIPVVDIRRLHKSTMVPGKSYLMLLQFAITNQRNDFYIKYLGSRSLTLDLLGFSSKDRFFVNENLTVAARAIKAKALLAKKDGKLHSVFTRDGVICIKKTPESESRRIETMEKLMEILQ